MITVWEAKQTVRNKKKTVVIVKMNYRVGAKVSNASGQMHHPQRRGAPDSSSPLPTMHL